MRKKVVTKMWAVTLFSMVIIGCTQGTQNQSLMGSGNRAALVVAETNLKDAFEAQSAYTNGLRSLVTDQKTRLTSSEFHEKLKRLPQFIGVGSPDDFQQYSEGGLFLYKILPALHWWKFQLLLTQILIM